LVDDRRSPKEGRVYGWGSQMTKKIKLNELKRLIASEARKIISEAKKSEETGEDSVDAQIDQYFANYELEGKNSKNEGMDFRRFMRRFLNEAEEEPEEEDKEEPKEEESKEEEPEKVEKKKLTSDDIDVDSFVDSVVRLVNNYDALLEVRNTILRRAVNFLLKGYEPTVADSFEESLLDRHGMEIGKSKQEKQDEDFVAPPADRAGASPGG